MSENDVFSMDTGKIMGDIATSLITNVAKSGWNKVKKFFQDIDSKESITLGTAYSSYLQNTYEKNSKVKTLIYRRIPKDLYSFYECIGVCYGGKTIDTKSICNLLKISNKLIITGTGGIGKSILLKHLFLDTIVNTEYIPVLIELRRFNNYDLKEISLYDTIHQNLRNHGFNLENEYYEYSLREGGYVILLDGFDEVNREKNRKVAEEIKEISDKYDKNRFIISSRPTDTFIGWNDFHEMSACSLSKKQALNLIKKIEFDETVKDTFYKALDESLFDKYQSFTSNPLLLTIMLLTFNNHASIPEKLNDFYEEAFSTLFNMHDATKDCYVRDIRSSLGCEDFKTVFSYICFKSYFRGEFEFSDSQLRNYIQQAKEKFSNLYFSIDDFQEDLISSVCLLVKDGLNYRFTHRSFQEYFAARYTCKLTDNIQYKVLTSWLEESMSVLTDEYFKMLFDLQPEKVNRIILCPGIKQIKELYDNEGSSLNFLKKLFDGIFVSKLYRNAKEYEYRVSLSIKNKYLCNIIRATCNNNNFSSTRDKFDPSVDKVAKAILGSHLKSKQISFDEALSIVELDELISSIQWFYPQLHFCFDVLEKNQEGSIIKKRKLSSIINEL